MKKIILYIVIVLIIVSLSVCGYLYYKASKVPGSAALVSNENISNSLDFIDSLYGYYKDNYNDFKLFQSYKLLSAQNIENSQLVMYLWDLSEGYYIDNDGLIQKIVTSSKPYKLTFYEENIIQDSKKIYNSYITGCEIGNNNSSTRKVFSMNIRKNFPTSDELQVMQHEIDLQVAEFYNAQKD